MTGASGAVQEQTPNSSWCGRAGGAVPELTTVRARRTTRR